MTEKRFIGSSGGVYDQYKGDRFTWAEWGEVLRIMNNLDEKARERSKALSKLQKENEQLKTGINSLKLIVRNWEALDEEKDEQLDRQNQALKKLKKENLDLSEELDYHKTKCASLETGLFQADRKNERLKKENKKLQDEYDKHLWLYNGLGCEYDSLKEENEELKKEIKVKDEIIELYYEMVKE